MESYIEQYVQKMQRCKTMTDLLVAMSAWQSFCETHEMSADEKSIVDRAYMEAERTLITKVKASLW